MNRNLIATLERTVRDAVIGYSHLVPNGILNEWLITLLGRLELGLSNNFTQVMISVQDQKEWRLFATGAGLSALRRFLMV